MLAYCQDRCARQHRDRRLLTDVSILDVPPRLALGLDDVVALLDEVLQEHLSSDCYDEGGVVGALVDVVVLLDDLLDTGDWTDVLEGLATGGRRCDGGLAEVED